MNVRRDFKIFNARVHSRDFSKSKRKWSVGVARFSFFFSLTDLQNGIRTALNKTAAAAKNNIDLLFNLECQLAKQAVPL